jgi:hypothetical protein
MSPQFVYVGTGVNLSTLILEVLTEIIDEFY